MAAAERNVSARSKWFVASLRNSKDFESCGKSGFLLESNARTIDTAADIARDSKRAASARSFLEAFVIGLFWFVTQPGFVRPRDW